MISRLFRKMLYLQSAMHSKYRLKVIILRMYQLANRPTVMQSTNPLSLKLAAERMKFNCKAREIPFSYTHRPHQ